MLSKYGFTVKKLIVKGIGKKDAVLTFKKGLNVVAGASDTGKSFAFECINYILGAKDTPSKPPEAEGYDTVLLEIQYNNNDEIVTLQRSLSESEKSKIYYIFSNTDNINNADFESLSSTHKSKKSLSRILLGLCNCTYENILASASKGSTQAFSFRDLTHITLLNETRVVGKNSPVYTSDSKKDFSRTAEATAFHTVIRGNDYKKFDKNEDPKITKAKLRGQVEELYSLSDTLRLEISDCIKNTQGYENEDVKSEIELSKKIIEDKKSIISSEETKYQEYKENYFKLVANLGRIKDNTKKFELLKKNYNSDIERLEFVEEAHSYTDQLINVRCPICHSETNEYSDMLSTDKSVYYEALAKEKKKLTVQLSDLEDTINDFTNDTLSISNQVEELQNKLKKSEELIENELNPVIANVLKKLEFLFNIRTYFININNNQNKITLFKARINELNEKMASKKVNENVTEIERLPNQLLNSLCDNISMLLSLWNFKNQDITFDFSKNDVIINGKEKSSFGKGARAIINTAFIIATMQFCLRRNLPHPSFVIVDSPLTTYKEKDKKQGALNEDVVDDIKQAFYKSLSKIGSECQIIIFDNVIPAESITNIEYHHFTGNDDIDRQGFIPKS